MLSFFDFLYFSFYKLYKMPSESSPEFASSCAVSGLQTFNIISVVWLCGYIGLGEIYLSKEFGVGLLISLFVINYIRYIRVSRFSHEVIRSRWEKMPLEKQKNYRWLLFAYVALSGLLFFGLALYGAGGKM